MARAIADKRILQREYLLAISRALTAELDLHDLLRLILQLAVEIVSGKAGLIALANENDDSFTVAAVYGIPPHLVDHFAPLIRGVPYEEGHETEALPVMEGRLRRIMRDAKLGLSRVIRLPMSSGGQVVGLIYVFQSGNYYFSDDAVSLLKSFAEQAAIAVKNARLYEQVNQEKLRLDAILENSADGIMILDSNLRITGFNKALSTMLKMPSNQAIGQDHDEVIQWCTLRTNTDLTAAMENGWPLPGGAHLYVEGDVNSCARDRDDTLEVVNMGISYVAMIDEMGQLTDIIANVRDLTRYREEEELQKTFISVVSHELKTPVSIIKGYAGTLKRPDAKWSPEILEESLTVIEEEADNLNDLIDNLLEASRLQSGMFTLEVSDDVNLARIAESVARRFSSQSSNHGIYLEFPPDFPAIIGDERRLTQVLNNLVSNGIKYSPDGGQIRLRGEVHPEYVTVSVADEGIGIPEHERPRIFHKFSRLDNALSRKTEGTGLGLFLSMAIVEAHNGRIWFTNNGDLEPGKVGTTFTFSLPIEVANPEDA